MAQEKIKFNAKEGLKGFDVAAAAPMSSFQNQLREGEVYEIYEARNANGEALEEQPWQGSTEKYPMVMTGDGIICNSPFIASLPVLGSKGNPIRNADKEDWECVLPGRIGKKLEGDAEIVYLADLINKDTGHYPKFKVRHVYPVAMDTADLKKRLKDTDKKSAYVEVLKVSVDDIKAEDYPYIPHCGRYGVQSSAAGQLRQIKLPVVELVD